MGNSVHVPLESLLGGIRAPQPAPAVLPAAGSMKAAPASARSFHIETFGCQMNAHDSEKVAGVLMARGYSMVNDPLAADVIFYNTCSIREKAAQKVFSRLGQFRGPAGRDKIIGVLGCVAQQEGEEI